MSGKRGSKASSASKFYLLACVHTQDDDDTVRYNVGSALLWLAVLNAFSLIPSRLRSSSSVLIQRASTTYAGLGEQVKWTQTLALLEPIHIILGLVRSNLPTTASQVASRLILVWGILTLFPQTQSNPFYAPMVFAWSIAEITRYSTYAVGLLEVKALEWARYHLFYVLYPIGAGSEAIIMFSALPYVAARYGSAGKYAIISLSTLVWPIALAVLMSHMHAQRRKYLGGSKRTTKKRS